MDYVANELMTLELGNKFKDGKITFDKRELEIMLEDAYKNGQEDGPDETEDA
jgi:hypothetical protein